MGPKHVSRPELTAYLRATGSVPAGREGAKRPRSWGYEVRVNDRTVGSAELAIDSMSGPTIGVLRSLLVDEASRRRGLGTAAVLAAEGMLRDWGCRQVMAYPPADGAAAQLLISLGYTGLSRLMAKPLRPVASALPASVRARPMTEAESRDWLKRPVDDFAKAWISRGMRPRPARARVRAAVQRALSADDAANVALRLLFHGDEAVGRLWVTRPGPESSPPGAYVYEVEVEQARRGEGFGRALMLLAEEIALDWGEAVIGLQVFNDNIPARRLYESLGYVTTADVLLKDLG